MILRIGDKVITPDGLGMIEGFEAFNKDKRILVNLDETKYSFSPVAYFKNEVKKELKPCK